MSAMDNNSKLRELQEENELLISQLHLMQEELERCYLKSNEPEAAFGSRVAAPGPSRVQLNAWVDDELPAALAENARLQSLLNLQNQIRAIEAENSLPARLAAELATVSTSKGRLVRVPEKLMSFWRKENNKAAPASLGGKGHPKLLAAYAEKGIAAASQLLEDRSLSATQKANAWTDLARHLQDSDPQNAAQAARHAYEADPKAFRLKWLAFRLNKAGDNQAAAAVLELVPADTALSASEQKSAEKIREKASREREQQAKQDSRFNTRRAEAEKQVQDLVAENGRLQSQVRKAQEESRSLKAEKEQLKSDFAEKMAKLSSEQSGLQAQHAEVKRAFASQIDELEVLKKIRDQLESESSLLQAQHAEVKKQFAFQSNELAVLEQARDQLMTESSLLQAQHAEVRRAFASQADELEVLKKIRDQLESESSLLRAQHAEVKKQLASKNDQLAALKQALDRLESEKSLLQMQSAEVKKQLVSQKDELFALQQAKLDLRAENATLTIQLAENRALADERLKQVIDLKRLIKSYQRNESGFTARQQWMHEEMTRAEAQLELIKSMLLSD